MIEIKRCSEVSVEQVYETFKKGFADYIIQIEMDFEAFWHHFFEVEGNELVLSMIAFDGEEAVGIAFGGFKTNESLKTLRLGAMSVIPEARGKGVGKALLEAHMALAKEVGCKQIFLEVIISNEGAVRFYEKAGYSVAYQLAYWKYKKEDLAKLPAANGVEEIVYDEMIEIRKTDRSHLPWQSSFEYMKGIDCRYFAIYEEDELIAGVAANGSKLFYLYVHPEYRGRNFGRRLLRKVVDEFNPKVLRFSYSNNHMMQTFATKLGMERDEIGQYEMYKWID